MAAIPTILGLDIGGANLKAAHGDGSATTVAFPLWQHPDRLTEEIVRLRERMAHAEMLALTMTGELCDCFATKRKGVRFILESVQRAFPKMPMRVWTNRGEFVDWNQAYADPLPIAAANWLALAQHVGSMFPRESVLLIDAGSTTTDISYLQRGHPLTAGLSDPERLASGSLVYTGVRRTPICAVLGLTVAAELFATMQDAYTWRRLLPEEAEDCDTADGRPMTRAHAHARLARMRCADVETFSEGDADLLADAALSAQWQCVEDAIQRIVRNKPVERIILAGSGEVLGRIVCQRRNDWNRIPQVSLADVLGPDLSVAACAYAVAMLAAGEAQ